MERRRRSARRACWNHARSFSWLARVGDGQEAVGAEAVGEEVVQDAAVLLAEDAVLRAVLGDLGDVVGEDPLQERLGVRPVRLDLAHVGDVEDADAASARSGAPRGSPRTARASPSRRTGRAAPRRRHAGRAAGCASASRYQRPSRPDPSSAQRALFGLHCRVMRAGMRGVVGALVVLATAAGGRAAGVGGDVRRRVVRRAGRGRRQPRVAAGVRRVHDVDDVRTSRLTRPRTSSRTSARRSCSMQIRAADGPPMRRFLTQRQLGLQTRRPATRVTRLETWRFGVTLRTAGDRDGSRAATKATPGAIFARDEGAQLIGGVFGETCTAPAGAIGCSFGSDTGVSDASHAVYPINVARISYSDLVRGRPSRLPALLRTTAPTADRHDQGLRHARDGHGHDRAEPQGRRAVCSTAGWHKARRRAHLRRDGQLGGPRRAARHGPLTRRDSRVVRLPPPRSCARRAGARRPSTVPSGTPDGTYAARIVAEDASGNETAVARTIGVDGTPPTAHPQARAGQARSCSR